MTKVILILVAALIGLTAKADQIDLAGVSELPALINPQIHVIPGEDMTDVQPQVYLKFKFYSCGQLSFNALVEEVQDGIKTIKVELPPQMDCMAMPLQPTEYELQLDSDFSDQRYLVLNPLVQEKPQVLTIDLNN